VILTIGKNLDREKFNFFLMCMDRGNGGHQSLMDMSEECGFRTLSVFVPNRLDPIAIREIRNKLRQLNIHIIHTHDFKSDFYALISSLGTGIKRVATSHGSTRDSTLLKLYLSFSERVVYPFYDIIIAVSDQRREDLSQSRAIQKKVVCIKNGFDLDLFQKSHASEKGELNFQVPEGTNLIGVISRLFPDKGHKHLLEAFSKLLEEIPEARLLIIGDGPSRSDLERLTKVLAIDHKVLFCGVRYDLLNIYSKLNLVAIPSLREGLPYVLFEALALKIPVVATSVGGIPDLIKNGETGFLVPPGDSDGLSNAMREALKDKEKAKSFSERGYELLKERFSQKKMLGELESSYLSLMHY
jgi:glycosyltransferase involved in cell wall biosynthesis